MWLRGSLFLSLDLDKWIYEPPSESEEDTKDDNLSFLLPSGGGSFGGASGGGTFGDARYSPTGSPKGKKKRKKRSKQELEEEEEMKKVSHYLFYDWFYFSYSKCDRI